MYPRCSRGNTQHQTRKLEYVLARAMKKKNSLLITVIVWKWNFLFYCKSSLVYTWTIKCREKNEECPHLLQDKLLVLPHWYSMESYFHLRQLASFELKIWIFNFYQPRGNKTFLDVLWNITFIFTEKNVIEQPFFKHFQTLASFSCKAQGNFSVPLK